MSRAPTIRIACDARWDPTLGLAAIACARDGLPMQSKIMKAADNNVAEALAIHLGMLTAARAGHKYCVFLTDSTSAYKWVMTGQHRDWATHRLMRQCVEMRQHSRGNWQIEHVARNRVTAAHTLAHLTWAAFLEGTMHTPSKRRT